MNLGKLLKEKKRDQKFISKEADLSIQQQRPHPPTPALAQIPNLSMVKQELAESRTLAKLTGSNDAFLNSKKYVIEMPKQPNFKNDQEYVLC